jgi:acyl carrier protein
MQTAIDVEHRIKEIVARHFKKPLATLDDQTRLREDLGGDSLDLLELVFELEQQLEVTIDDVAAAELRTIGDAVRHVERLRA